MASSIPGTDMNIPPEKVVIDGIYFTIHYQINFKDNLKKKYKESAMNICPKEICEITKEVVQIYFFPEDINFIITVDHEGTVIIDATKEFIEQFKQFFPEWKKFSRLY